MEIIVNAISTAVLIVLEIILFFILMYTVLPKILRVRCTAKASRSRGLKKYIYPSGRGVTYEPHPSVRRYIDRYLLFTNDGYKYIKCRLCGDIKGIEYSVIMYNRKNKIIDVIDVNETKICATETSPVVLHHETSYADIVVTSVNGVKIPQKSLLCYKIWDIGIYALSVAALCFAELAFIYGIVNLYLGWFGLSDYLLHLNIAHFIIPSLIIGIITGALAYLNGRSKGVRGSV